MASEFERRDEWAASQADKAATRAYSVALRLGDSEEVARDIRDGTWSETYEKLRPRTAPAALVDCEG